jgi:hypothetical protein
MIDNFLDDDERLIPDPAAAKMQGVTLRTLRRRSQIDPDFPPVIQINRRHYRRLGQMRRYLAKRTVAIKGAEAKLRDEDTGRFTSAL